VNGLTGRRELVKACVIRQFTTFAWPGMGSFSFSPPPSLASAARERKPARIAFEKKSSIGSLVDPRHFSDKNSTHTVVGTECIACLTARCAAPKRAALPSGTT